MGETTVQYSWIRKFFLHLHTINTHRFEVMKNCFACGLYFQGLTHDLSKYSPSEFIESVRYFQGNRSPYMYEKEHFGYANGWMHQKGRNRHHWEYWYDLKDGIWQPLPMPYQYFVEMVCDRVAACRIYQKKAYTSASALEYFNTRNDRLYMHPSTAEQLHDVLQQIAQNGEKAVFAQLKVQLKQYQKPQTDQR